jgi:hypothetical protein
MRPYLEKPILKKGWWGVSRWRLNSKPSTTKKIKERKKGREGGRKGKKEEC